MFCLSNLQATQPDAIQTALRLCLDPIECDEGCQFAVVKVRQLRFTSSDNVAVWPGKWLIQENVEKESTNIEDFYRVNQIQFVSQSSITEETDQYI